MRRDSIPPAIIKIVYLNGVRYEVPVPSVDGVQKYHW